MMSKPSNSPASPVVVRHISQDKIERGQKLQAAMEEIDALEATVLPGFLAVQKVVTTRHQQISTKLGQNAMCK